MSSGKIIVIVESPAKCKKIESFLGPDYVCVASYGHLRELKTLKDINKKYVPSFTNAESKLNQINKLRGLIKKAKDVIIATDDDREGEGIGWHICDLFNLPPQSTKRIIFNEITKTALIDAVKYPTILNMNLVYAQQARQILDLIVGYRISPVLWENISRKSGLSAGRCQSPALKIIYENQKTIEKSPGSQSYNTVGYFTKHTIPFSLNHNFKTGKEVEEFLTETVNHEHKMKCEKERDVTKSSPNPFTTSKLQQQASTEIKTSPKETMKLCQTLYEAGLITYMRTDSTKYSKEFIETAKEHIIKTYGDKYVHESVDTLTDGARKDRMKKNTKKTAKEDTKCKDDNNNNAQEAHEAIRPTDISVIEARKDMQPKEKRMYKLIWNNTIESCMRDSKYKQMTTVISAHGGNTFRYSSEKNIFPGWKIVRGVNDTSEYYQYLITLEKERQFNYSKIVCNFSLKELKTHYTEAKLVELLESNGIGRPSTFSSIIDKIQDRGYVKKENVKGKMLKCINYELIDNEIDEKIEEKEFGNENNKLVIQPTGVLVIEFLMKQFGQFIDYDYTKTMEERLDRIARGDETCFDLCNSCSNELTVLINGCKKEKDSNTSEVGASSGIKIDDYHTYVVAKYGPVIRQVKNGETKFITVKPNIDVERLKRGEYEINEIIDVIGSASGKYLGRYNKEDIYLKKGKYGLYINLGGKNKSVNNIDKAEQEIILADVIKSIESALPTSIMRYANDGGYSGESNKEIPKSLPTSVVRYLSKELTIRKGRFGHYIFYKTNEMTKPKFLQLKKYGGDYIEDNTEDVISWITTTYLSK